MLPRPPSRSRVRCGKIGMEKSFRSGREAARPQHPLPSLSVSLSFLFLSLSLVLCSFSLALKCKKRKWKRPFFLSCFARNAIPSLFFSRKSLGNQFWQHGRKKRKRFFCVRPALAFLSLPNCKHQQFQEKKKSSPENDTIKVVST